MQPITFDNQGSGPNAVIPELRRCGRNDGGIASEAAA